jgi:hydrogenase maturation protease
MRLVVFGWGNESRGDDGLGPALLARIEALGLAEVETVEDYQLQIEHALDLDGADLALFVDAARTGAAPFFFQEVHANPEATPSTHALSPAALLDVYARVRGEPPPAFVLGVLGERFELGEGLSAVGAEGLEAAWDFARARLENPAVEAWRKAANG